jgi:arylformamidase
MMQQPRAKGPRVYLDYDQAELDAAYDQQVYAPNHAQLLARRVKGSAAVRARIGEPERFAYGPTAIEGLDVYRTTRPNAPILVFIHGGAWRNGMAKDYGFAAETFVTAGAHYVVPDFTLVQDAGGSLMPMIDQVRRSILWTWRNAAKFGGDASRLYLAGHSSGGHLSGCALITNWAKDYDAPPDIIKGGTCCSGMFDLEPVRLSARSNYVKFDDAMVAALSAIRHIDQLRCPLILAHGTEETPEFQRQSRDFFAAVKAAGKPVQLLVGDNLNHFEMAETLANPFGLLGRAIFGQMRLKLIPA